MFFDYRLRRKGIIKSDILFVFFCFASSLVIKLIFIFFFIFLWSHGVNRVIIFGLHNIVGLFDGGL